MYYGSRKILKLYVLFCFSEENIAECVSEALQVHKSLVRLNADSEIQLVSVHTPDVQINPDRLKGRKFITILILMCIE